MCLRRHVSMRQFRAVTGFVLPILELVSMSGRACWRIDSPSHRSPTRQILKPHTRTQVTKSKPGLAKSYTWRRSSRTGTSTADFSTLGVRVRNMKTLDAGKNLPERLSQQGFLT